MGAGVGGNIFRLKGNSMAGYASLEPNFLVNGLWLEIKGDHFCYSADDSVLDYSENMKLSCGK